MVFSELSFIFAFLPLTLLIYYIVPFKFKNLLLLASGLLFYSWGEPYYVYVMVLSTLIDYLAGRVMARFNESPAVRRAALIVSVVMNLSLLAVFKYSGMMIGAADAVFSLGIAVGEVHLPIGISFFTFQSMSYTIDLYRRHIGVQKNFIDFAAFVTMFPQIVAGPIVRYGDVAAQLRRRTINIDMLGEGVRLFICGLSKKVLIANSLGECWAQVKACEYSSLAAANAWFGILCFTFQIYFDFSGYSDMAIGLGKMLGFNFPKNFDYPYLSKSVSMFWRRWHITLGSWFKSYLYIPLGGNQKGSARTILNLAIVWFLTGLWHGASWNFVLWGLYYGALIIGEKFFYGKYLSRLPSFLQTLLTFLSAVFGWVLFETTDVAKVPGFFFAMFGKGGALSDGATGFYIYHYSAALIAAALIAFKIPQRLISRLKKLRPISAVFPGVCVFSEFAAFAVSIIYLVNAGYNPFLYFNF